MGAGSWSPDDYVTRTASIKSAPVGDVFKTRSASDVKEYLDPKKVEVRESRDSTDHPASTAIVFATDVTGSMGVYAKAIAVDSLGVLINELHDRKPVTDPQI